MDKYAQLASLFNPSAGSGTSELDQLFGLRPVSDEEIEAKRAARKARIEALLSGEGEEQRVEPSQGAQLLAPGKIPELSGNLKKRAEQLAPIYQEVSAKYGVPYDLLMAQAHAESQFNPAAVSSKGAVGTAQFMPDTAKRFGLTNPSDPVASAHAQAKYMRNLLDMFGGDPSLALAGYNAGEGNVKKHGGIPNFKETRDYVARVNQLRGLYSGQPSVPIQSPAGSPADQTLPPDQEPQADTSGLVPVMLSNNQQAYMEPDMSLEDVAKQLKEMNIDAVPLRQFNIKSDTPVYVEYDMNDEDALAQLRKKNPEILKAAGLPTDTSAWGAYKQALASGVGQLGVAGGIGLEALGAEGAGKYLQEKGRALEEESKGMFTQPTEAEAGPVARHFGIPLAQGMAGITTVAPALLAGPGAGLVGAGLISGAQEYGALEQKAREEGKPFEKVGAVAPAAAVGVINAAADKFLLPFFKVASSEAGVASGKAIRSIVDSEGADVAKQKIGSYVGDMLKNAGMAEASGASADIATHLIEKSYQDKPIGTEETWNEIKDILAQGAPTYLTMGALGGAGEQHIKRTELEKIKEQDIAEAKMAEQKRRAEARLAESQDVYAPTVFDEERPITYEDLDLTGKSSKIMMNQLNKLDIEDPKNADVINQILDHAEEIGIEHNPAAMQALRSKIQEVKDASEIQGAEQIDAGRGPRSEGGEEAGYPPVGGEGVRVSDEISEEAPRETQVPQTEEVEVPETLAAARARLRGHGLASKIVEPTLGETMRQDYSNLVAEGRKPDLRAEIVDKSSALRTIDKNLPSLVGGVLSPSIRAGHLAQAGNIISRGVAEGTPTLLPSGITEITPDAAKAPLQILQRAEKAGRSKEVSEALVAQRYFDFERQADAKQAEADSHLREAADLRSRAEAETNPKEARELKIRANQLEAKGNKLAEAVEPLRAKQRTVITPEQAKTAKYVYDNDPAVKEAVDGVYGNLQSLLKYLHDTQVITPKQYEDFKANVNYFPFHEDRNFEEALQDPYSSLPAMIKQMGSSGKSIPAIKRQKHHAHEIFTEKNLLKQNAWATNLGMQNINRLHTIDVMEASGVAEYVDAAHKGDKDVVQVNRQGVPEYYRIKDPDQFAALSIAGPTLSPFFKTWGKATGAIRSGMLLTPRYFVGQPLRESLTATLVGRSAAVSPFDALKEITKIAAGKSETYNKLKNKGILSSPDVISDPVAFLREVEDRPGLHKVGKNVQHLYEALDGAIRDVLYDKEYATAIKRGMSEADADAIASAKARDITNFSVQGRNQMIRNLKATTPFFNAAIQSLDVLARAAFPRTLGKLSKGEAMEARRLFYSRVAFLAAFSTAYAVAMSDNEDYLKSKDRANNFLFPNPEGDEDHPLVKIGGVPYEAGFFAKVIPETLTLLNMGKISSEQAAKELKTAGYDLLVSGLVPTVYLVQPMIENAINRSFHFGTPIESEPGLSEEFRNRRASELSKAIYEKLDEMGVKIPLAESPDKMENLARGYGTQYWTLIKSLADGYLKNRAGGPTAPDQSWMDKPYAKDFFPSPKRTTDTETFYEIRDKSNQIMDDLHKAENVHNQEMYERTLRLPDAEKLFNANPMLSEDSKKLADIDNKIREITDSRDPELTAKRKAEIIKDWEHQKQAIYSSSVQEMKRAGIIKE